MNNAIKYINEIHHFNSIYVYWIDMLDNRTPTVSNHPVKLSRRFMNGVLSNATKNKDVLSGKFKVEKI